MLKNNLKEDRYFSLSGYDTEMIKTRTSDEISIKTLTETEQKTYDVSAEVIKQIEDTAANVVRQDQRGNIIFDPEKNAIKSRSTETKIDIKNLTIP